MNKIYTAAVILVLLSVGGCNPTGKSPAEYEAAIVKALAEYPELEAKASCTGAMAAVGINVQAVNDDAADLMYEVAFLVQKVWPAVPKVRVTAAFRGNALVTAEIAGADLIAAAKEKISAEEFLERTEVVTYDTPADILTRQLSAFDVIIQEIRYDGNTAMIIADYAKPDPSEISRDTIAMALVALAGVPWVDELYITYFRDEQNYLVFGFNAEVLAGKAAGAVSDEEFLAGIMVDGKGQYFPSVPEGPDVLVSGTCINDGTGNGKVKKQGGNYFGLPTSEMAPASEIRLTVLSGTFKYITIHARYQGGIWKTVYQGQEKIFPASAFSDAVQGGATHLLISVNGEHERYEGIACTVQVDLVSTE